MKYLSPVLVFALLCLMYAGTAGAQVTPPPAAGYSSSSSMAGFFQPSSQPRFSLTPYGGAYVAQDYSALYEGLQAEQTLTERIGLVGRATGYQLFITSNATSPLAPTSKQAARLNFGRFEGGLDFSLLPGTNLVLLGGHDVGDSDAWIIEGDISSWWFQQSAHPVNFYATPIHDFQSGVTQSEIDLRMIINRGADWDTMIGVGGAIWGGGIIHGVKGEGGPILDFYNRPWQFGVDMQAGYGDPGVYGMLVLYKTITFLE